MRIFASTLFASVLCGTFPATAQADDCSARLAALLGSIPYEGQPYEVRLQSDTNGVPGLFIQKWASPRHGLIHTLEPAGMADTLHHEGAAYAPDGQGGWTKLYEADPAQQDKDAAAFRATLAANVRTATCGSDTRDGITYVLVAGTVAAMPPYDGDLTYRYLLVPDSGAIAHMDMDYTMSGLLTTSTFAFSPAPGLTLPTP
jgi:hypothetical protein